MENDAVKVVTPIDGTPAAEAGVINRRKKENQRNEMTITCAWSVNHP